MKKNDVKKEIESKREQANAILMKALEESNRALNEQEITDYKGFENEIKRLKENLDIIERKEVEDKELFERNVETSNDSKELTFSDIRQRKGDWMPLSKRAITTSSTNLINTTKDGLSTVKSRTLDLINNLGVKMYSLNGEQRELPWIANLVASKVSESGTLSNASFTDGKSTLKPTRFQISLSFTEEYLASLPQSMFNDIIQEMGEACFRGVYKDLNSTITGNTYVASGSTTGWTYDNILASHFGIDGSLLTNPQYNTDKLTAQSLLQVTKTTGQMVVNDINMTILGDKLNVSGLLPANTLIHGDYEYSAIGVWNNGLQVMADPYSNSSTGVINLRVSLIACTAVRNPYAFYYIKKS